MALIGLMADIHGNREALDAVLGALDARGVSRIVCLGDVIGYNADPDYCAALLRRRRIACIAGNHDLIGIGRLGPERCSNKARHALERTHRMLSGDTALYLASLPSHLLIEERILLVHGGVDDVQQYIVHPRHVAQNAARLRARFPDAAVCFFGHAHEQRVFECDGEAVSECAVGGGPVSLAGRGVRFANPGSVDASRKKGAKLAEYAVFDTGSSSVAFHRVPYDDELAERKAAAAGLRIEPWRDCLYRWRRRLMAVVHGQGRPLRRHP